MATSELVAFDLGPVPTELATPKEVELAGQRYYLTAVGGQFLLVSRVCPHAGGEVSDTGSCFECPQHDWQFDRSNGAGLNPFGVRLAAVPVHVRDGRLEATLRAGPSFFAAAPVLRQCDLKIKLLGHAGLELRHAGFGLVTDPWLAGPAMLGAWAQFPPPMAKPQTINPDALWISRERSDHFHEPTLDLLNHELPVYVPAYPNGRLARRLAALGFADVTEVPFAEPVTIAEGFTLTCFEPGGPREAPAVLFEIDGFRSLSLDDGQINHEVGRVDLLAIAPGPVDALETIRKAVSLYQPAYLMPFASSFTLWHPDHRAAIEGTAGPGIAEIRSALAGEPVEVVDLLPNEVFDAARGATAYLWGRREGMFGPEAALSYADRRFDPEVFKQHHPSKAGFDRAQAEAYFLGLNRTAEIAACEELSAVVETTSGGSLALEIADGRLSVLSDPPPQPDLTIRLPDGVLAAIISGETSWDEACLGRWCRFTRSPDAFPSFWRLLNA